MAAESCLWLQVAIKFFRSAVDYDAEAHIVSQAGIAPPALVLRRFGTVRPLALEG